MLRSVVIKKGKEKRERENYIIKREINKERIVDDFDEILRCSLKKEKKNKIK